MSLALVLPGLLAVAIGVGAGLVPWPVKPVVAVRLLTATAAITATTVLVIVTTPALGFLSRLEVVRSIVELCPVLPVHHQVGFATGIPAVVALGFMAVRIRRVLSQRRRAMAGTDGERISVIESPEPFAYAAPGSPGCIVVSTGLLALLEPRERQVLFAHERAHLSQQHHRYLLVGALSTAVLPFLAPLVTQLRLATERCADEAAVEAMGGDREIVASAIARAALGTSIHSGLVAAFGGGSVPRRVNALVGSPVSTPVIAVGVVAGFLTMTAAVGAMSVQLHHFAQLVDHICGP